MAKIEAKTYEEMYPDKPAVEGDDKHYPYGTSLEFSNEVAKELNADSMSVGDEGEVRGKAFVKSKSINESDGSSRIEICIQMTEIDLNEQNPDRAKQLYGE